MIDGATALGSSSPRGARTVLDAEGNRIGTFIESSPESGAVAGFSGSTNVAIAFDDRMAISGMRILHSDDTRDHVNDIERDEFFLDSLNGLTWDEALERAPSVDGVSGATLTSLAILEGVMRRLERQSAGANTTSAQTRSLKFPSEISLDEANTIFPGAVNLRARKDHPLIFDVLNENAQRIGGLARTAPPADSVVGFQGPTDSLIAFDRNDRVIGLQIRKSFDNEPYVRYVKEDSYFKTHFIGQALTDLATLDLVDAEVEGVSGATMTSMAVAEALPIAARAALTPVTAGTESRGEVKRERSIIFSARDAGTIAILLIACLTAFTRVRGVVWFRRCFQLVLIGYLGFLNGDLLSQAQLIGWGAHGVPWRFAPGFVVLTAASLLIPMFTKRQVYCQQICPFGAAQKLIRPTRTPKWAKRFRPMRFVPATLAAVCVLVGYFDLPIELASLEPFDAFLFGGVASIAIAIIGLVVSLRVPMAFCRFGCPTGAMLGFIRFRSNADRLDWRDALAVGLLLIGLAVVFNSV